MNKIQDAYTKCMEIQKTIAVNLAKARGGMSRQELAKLSGVTYQTIYDIEEERRKPSLDVLDNLSKALRIEASELLRPSSPTAFKGKVSEALRFMASVPDEIYELSVELGADHKAWKDVKDVLEREVEILKEQKAKNHA